MSRRIVYEMSFLVAVCVLSLFLFPASFGPYAAVHGPATALQAARSSTQLQTAIAGAPKNCSGNTLFQGAAAPSRITDCAGDLVLVTWHGGNSVLRC